MSLEPDERDFQIDRFRLDDEWVRQPDLFRRYSETLAMAKAEHDGLKNDLDVIRAETELKIRQDPDSYGLDKVTEGVIKATVEVQPEVKQAEKDVVTARYKVGVLEAAVGALDHRKRALSDLVSLHLADYFSKPVAREEDRDAREEMGKQRARRSQRRRTDKDD